MTPGAYLRHCRQEAALTVDDVALRLDSAPAIAAIERAAWLARIEEGIDPLGALSAAALVQIEELRLDAEHLALLIDRANGVDVTIRLRPAGVLRGKAA